MKDQKKDKKPQVEIAYGARFTINEELNKYLSPEHQPEKLKRIREQFKKPIVIHQ